MKLSIKLSMLAVAAALTLGASASFAQVPAPENRSSTSMQKDGGASSPSTDHAGAKMGDGKTANSDTARVHHRAMRSDRMRRRGDRMRRRMMMMRHRMRRMRRHGAHHDTSHVRHRKPMNSTNPNAGTSGSAPKSSAAPSSAAPLSAAPSSAAPSPAASSPAKEPSSSNGATAPASNSAAPPADAPATSSPAPGSSTPTDNTPAAPKP